MKAFIHSLSRLALLCCVCASTIQAQSVSINGSVRDAQNGESLIGANVAVIGTSLGSATDVEGNFSIPNVAPGTYELRVAYIGYTTLIDIVEVTGQADVVRDYSLVYTKIEGEEVVITAQAKGQMDAISRQLAEKSMVNVVSSDRIQELPDANAAESVARIPGVTVQREGGEGNKVVIRGLSPKYNTVSVNGVRLAATDSSNRSTDLSMVSQYMLEGIEVTKAGTPDQDGDVLGGRVNFRLKRAEPGFHINTVTQGMYNGLSNSASDYKVVLNASNRFLNGRLGVLGLVDVENRFRGSHELSASYDNPNARLDSVNTLRSTGLRLGDIRRDNDRLNTLLVTDYRLRNGQMSYSFLNSSINTDRTQYSESYALANNGRSFTSGEGEGTTRVNTHILEYEQTFNGKLHLEGKVSWSRSSQSAQIFNASFLEELAFTRTVIGLNVNRIQDFLANDLNSAFARGYGINTDISEETDRAANLDAGYDFKLTDNISGTFQVGAKIRLKDRSYDKNIEAGRLDGAFQPAMDALIAEFPRLAAFRNPGTRRFPYAAFVDPEYDGEDFLSGDFALGPFADLPFLREISEFLAENWSSATYWEEIAHTYHQTNSQLYDYSGEETYTATYAMADVNLGSKLNVVAGARYERNKTLYNSWRGWQNVITSYTFAGYEFVSQERVNDFILPALFVRYRPFSWLEARFASTKTLARPDYVDILPLASYSGQNKSVELRNAKLRAATSDNIDVSLSVSGNKIGFLSVGVFQKNIKDLMFSSGRRYISDPAEFDLPEELEKGFIQQVIVNNPNDVRLRGLELDYQTRFWYLPSFLSGLVFNANYTVTTSEVKYPRTVIDFEIDFGPPLEVISINRDTLYVDRLIDQPDQVMNFSLGYDYRGFSARLSMLYRSNIFRRTDFWPELRESTDGFRRWDLSIRQSLPVDGLDAYLNVSNISESEDVNRLLDQASTLGLRQYYGRTIDLGLRFSF